MTKTHVLETGVTDKLESLTTFKCLVMTTTLVPKTLAITLLDVSTDLLSSLATITTNVLWTDVTLN